MNEHISTLKRLLAKARLEHAINIDSRCVEDCEETSDRIAAITAAIATLEAKVDTETLKREIESIERRLSVAVEAMARIAVYDVPDARAMIDIARDTLATIRDGRAGENPAFEPTAARSGQAVGSKGMLGPGENDAG